MDRPFRLDELEFREAPHSYYVRGRELSSVTTILRQYGLGFQGYAPQEALVRGNWVHQASVFIDEGDLDWSAVPAEYQGYCEAYRRALAELKLEASVAEWRSWHPVLWYAGTSDRVGFWRGKRGIWDLKTGDATDVHAQLAAYQKLWEFWHPTFPIEWGACLKLNDNGTYRWTPVDLADGWRVFAACLVIEEAKRMRRAA